MIGFASGAAIHEHDEPFTGPERGILDGLLDWHRATLLWKCAGLTGEQFALASVPPSNLSLLGIVRHMADMERAWFRIRFRGESLPRLYDYEDAAFEHADSARAEADFAVFAEECDLARKAVAGAPLDGEFTRRAWPHAVAALGLRPHDRGVRPAQRPRRPATPAHRRGDRLLTDGPGRLNTARCADRIPNGLNHGPFGQKSFIISNAERFEDDVTVVLVRIPTTGSGPRPL